ncbi:hypothetical protein [Flavobacterium beibuense]|uniref:hypothetical protein n=1 Tax=Flavobacterium beibuense TaxID=657326 RepID=UPI003A8E1F6C
MPFSFEQELNPLKSLECSYATTSKDMAVSKFDAWCYGIICGWDDASYKDLQIIHSWSDNDVDLNKTLHENYIKLLNEAKI